MMKLGRVSTETKGLPQVDWVEDEAECLEGEFIYRPTSKCPPALGT